MQALMNPAFTTLDARVNLQQWDRDLLRYQDRFSETYAESLRMHIYMEKIAPSEFRNHVLLNKDKFGTAEKIREGIESYVDTRRT